MAPYVRKCPMKIYRPTSSYVWGWLLVALGGAVLLAQLLSTGTADARVGFGLGAALAGSGVAAFLLPSLRVGEHAAEVHNTLQIVTVPYARLEAISAQWTLELFTSEGRRVGVTAAPVRSRRDRMRPDKAGLPEAGAVVQAGWDAWRRNTHGPALGLDEQQV